MNRRTTLRLAALLLGLAALIALAVDRFVVPFLPASLHFAGGVGGGGDGDNSEDYFYNFEIGGIADGDDGSDAAGAAAAPALPLPPLPQQQKKQHQPQQQQQQQQQGGGGGNNYGAALLAAAHDDDPLFYRYSDDTGPLANDPVAEWAQRPRPHDIDQQQQVVVVVTVFVPAEDESATATPTLEEGVVAGSTPTPTMTATTTTAAAPPPASTSLSARRQRKLQKQLQEQQKQKQQQGEQSSSATFAPAGITVNGVPPKPKLILEPPASAFSHLRLHRDTDRSLKKHPIPAHRGVADAYRAHYVREMLQHAWKGYATFALDADDLQPLSATPHNWYAGGGTLLNTAVDALSTLFVANLTAEYEVAKEAVLMHYLRPSTLRRVQRMKKRKAAAAALALQGDDEDEDEELEDDGDAADDAADDGEADAEIDADTDADADDTPRFARSFSEHVNVFETTIRVLGGLLGAYELDGDALLLEAARGVADRLLPALDAGEGGALPLNYVNLADGTARDQYGGKTWIVLSQAGSLQLEFQYLSDVTGDPVYAEKALAVLRNLAAKPGSNIPGLVPSHFTAAAQSPFHKVQAYGVGPNSDSYYEYLLKLYVATGDARFMDMFAKAADAMVMYMLQESPDGVFTYLPDINSQQPGVATPNQMFHHLSCFTGGMFALSSLTTCPHRAHPAHLPAPHTCASQELLIARKLTSTCVATATLPDTAGVGFELAGIELQKGGPVLYDRGYSLRPEIVESVFYLWRITGDVVWREVGWKLAQKLNTRCRNAVGFHVLNDVYDPASAFDRQESFFLAETLKYLYLLFSDDSLIPLDRYVFNTEAHPLSIRGHGRRKDVKWGTKTPM